LNHFSLALLQNPPKVLKEANKNLKQFGEKKNAELQAEFTSVIKLQK
jgi:hypothetical protein